MAVSKKAKRITEHIYRAYGSDSGYLFGILPQNKSAVEAIVQCTLDIANEPEMNVETEEEI